MTIILSLPQPTESDKVRFWSKVETSFNDEDCWTWKGASRVKSGYGSFDLNGVSVQAHRFSHLITKGNPNNSLVLHSCGCRNCVNPVHLRLGTHRDNSDDRMKDGTTAIGERQGKAKLTNEIVREMRRRNQSGETVAVLAREFKVNHASAWRAIHREHWKHIE